MNSQSMRLVIWSLFVDSTVCACDNVVPDLLACTVQRRQRAAPASRKPVAAADRVHCMVCVSMGAPILKKLHGPWVPGSRPRGAYFLQKGLPLWDERAVPCVCHVVLVHLPGSGTAPTATTPGTRVEGLHAVPERGQREMVDLKLESGNLLPKLAHSVLCEYFSETSACEVQHGRHFLTHCVDHNNISLCLFHYVSFIKSLSLRL